MTTRFAGSGNSFLPAAALLGGAGLVVDQRRKPWRLVKPAHRVELVAMAHRQPAAQLCKRADIYPVIRHE
jgi:hypothetical protein